MTGLNVNSSNRVPRGLRAVIAALSVAAASIVLGGCIDTGKIGIKSTSATLKKGAQATQEESDYTLASRSIPAGLKTAETFHYAYPDITRLTWILAEGYCGYGAGFDTAERVCRPASPSASTRQTCTRGAPPRCSYAV